MVSDYLIRLKTKDRDIPQVTNIGSYTMEIDGEFVMFGTFDKNIFDKWLTDLRAANVWHEANSA